MDCLQIPAQWFLSGFLVNRRIEERALSLPHEEGRGAGLAVLPPGVADPRQPGLHRRPDVLHHGVRVNCATGHQPATCQEQTGIF
jgi:hypothetical protein